ncbi:MAG: hypothetical protein WBA74_17800, partial [Cyclobacteriaceae bacterium]
MVENKIKRRRIIYTILFAFTLPPIFVILLDYLGAIFDGDMVWKLIITWPLYAFILPLLIGIPAYMNRQLRKVEELIIEKDYGMLSKKRKNLIWSFIVLATFYSSVSIGVGYFSGFTYKQNVLAFLVALAYIVAGNVPLVMRFTAQLDSLLASVPQKYITNSSLKGKTLLMNSSLAMGGALVMVTTTYSLLWRMEEFPELGFDRGLVMTRLVYIALIVVFFQILPGTVVTSDYARFLKKIGSFVKTLSEKDLNHKLYIS